jgi:hypothetical protein
MVTPIHEKYDTNANYFDALKTLDFAIASEFLDFNLDEAIALLKAIRVKS